MKLVNPVTPSQAVNLVCLPNKYEDDNLNDTPISVSGWGNTGSSLTPLSSVLKATTLMFVAPEQCNSMWAKFHLQVGQNIQFCANQPNKRTGICNGDSGGKLYIFYLWINSSIPFYNFYVMQILPSGILSY